MDPWDPTWVQPGVSMANYQYYIDQKRKILEKYCY